MKKKQREFHIVIEKDEDGYFVAEVPELPGCHTQAKSLDKLIERAQEAILLCLEVKERKPEVELLRKILRDIKMESQEFSKIL